MAHPTSRALRLISQLQISDYAHLSSKAESILFQAVASEIEVDVNCSPGFTLSDSDVRSPQNWHADQAIRGGFIRWLCNQIFDSTKNHTPTFTIRGAHFIQSQVDLSGFLDPLAIRFELCRFDEPVDLSESHFASLHLDSTWVPSLFAKGVVVDKELSFARFASQKLTSIERARIGGDIDFTGSVLGEKRSICNAEEDEDCNVIVDCQNIQVGGSIYLDACTVWGAINLTGAEIDADLDCGKCHLDGLGNASLLLEKAVIAGSIFFVDGFQSIGELWINNAVVKNGIYAQGGIFKSRESVIPGSGQTAIMIENSQILGESYFARADKNGHGCSAEGVSLQDSDFRILSFLGKVSGSGLNLKNAKVIEFTDLAANWPRNGTLHLDGFVYERLRDQENPDKISVDDARLGRLVWLRLDPGKSPQPYMQLAQVLKEQGDDFGATKVLTEMEARLNRDRPRLGRTEGDLLIPFSYGYAPQNAIWLLLGVTGLGWIIYRRSFVAGIITPTEKDAYKDFRSTKQTPSHYPRFSAFIYSLENTFPLVDLGQSSRWQPDPDSVPVPVVAKQSLGPEDIERHTRPSLRILVRRSLNYLTRPLTAQQLRVFLWAQILVGWLLATLFVAGITGLIRR